MGGGGGAVERLGVPVGERCFAAGELAQRGFCLPQAEGAGLLQGRERLLDAGYGGLVRCDVEVADRVVD